jgi:hypothetical protein
LIVDDRLLRLTGHKSGYASFFHAAEPGAGAKTRLTKNGTQRAGGGQAAIRVQNRGLARSPGWEEIAEQSLDCRNSGRILAVTMSSLDSALDRSHQMTKNERAGEPSAVFAAKPDTHVFFQLLWSCFE